MTSHPDRGELEADAFEAVGDGLRAIEVGLVVFLGLLICPPLLILAVIVAVPALAITLVVAAVAAAIAVPTLLVRRVRAHHREHQTTWFLHRVMP